MIQTIEDNLVGEDGKINGKEDKNHLLVNLEMLLEDYQTESTAMMIRDI